MTNLFSSPMFGITLCIFTFAIGQYAYKKTRSPLCSPILIAIILSLCFLQFFHISYENFNHGGSIISMFLAPATAALALSIYRQFHLLKKYFLPIFLGATIGSLTSLLSVFSLCKLFGLDTVLIASLLPKSVTTPMAMEISTKLGGILPLTVLSVIITGISGFVLSPILVKFLRLKNPIAIGVAIGTSSHAVGTSKAIEMGEIQGAMSGISIGIAGMITVLFSLFISL